MARLDVIRMFLTLAVYKNFKVYQMDVKSTFLNGNLEVYIEQPDSFHLGDDPNLVCKLKKVLYGLNRMVFKNGKLSYKRGIQERYDG